MKNIVTIIFAFFIVHTVSAQTGGTEFYVSPSGNDNNPGSIAKPFHSIEKAKEAVRSALSENLLQNITVYLRGGDYFRNKSLSRFLCMLRTSEGITTGEVLFEIRLDSPEGDLIGSIRGGETKARVKTVTGVHTLFLIFRRNIMLDSFRFLN